MTLSTESSRGYIIGSAYTPPEGKSLDDTARVLELKDDSTLSVKIGETTVVIDKDNVTVNGTNLNLKGAVNIEGNTNITGNLTVSGDIKSEKGEIHAMKGEVKDGIMSIGRAESLSQIRQKFNLHTHPAGNLGAPIPVILPNENM